MPVRKYIVLILFNFCFLKINGQELPKYIFINSATGVNWSVKKPGTINRQVFDEVLNSINASHNNKLKVGISFVFDFLSTDKDSVKKSLERFLELSQQTKVPILIHIDGVNWWNARPDLWNWWDPARPGYNPENKKNVEWTSWDESSAVKISWRNRGRQLRVLPAPNLARPAVLNAHLEGLHQLIPGILNL